MGNDAAEHAIEETGGRPRLTPRQRSAVIQELESLGDCAAGPDPSGLVDLIEDTLELARKPWPAIDESLSDFVPSQLRAAFDMQEEECRGELRKLIAQAQKVQRLMHKGSDLSFAEVEPFTCALTRLCSTPETSPSDDFLVAMRIAIDQLASANLLLEDHEKPGTRPIYNATRLVVRAGYYYRYLHRLPLELNFDYADRTGVKPGSRSRPGDLEARTATANLAWGLIQAFGTGGDMAEVQTHLRNYHRELKAANRGPQRSDFQLGFV